MFGPSGTLTKNGDTNVITFRRTFNVPPERVWEALTTQDGLTSWLAVSASIDARHGGSVEIEFDDDQTVSGSITRWDPTSHFAHTWDINGEIASDVQYSLTPAGEGTELTLIHTGLPNEMCGGYTPGWHAITERLAAVVEGAEVPDWLTVFEQVAPKYVWSGSRRNRIHVPRSLTRKNAS